MHAAEGLLLILVALGDLTALVWIRQRHRRQRMAKRMIACLSGAIHREMASGGRTGRPVLRHAN
jgi:hypothetical protein